VPFLGPPGACRECLLPVPLSPSLPSNTVQTVCGLRPPAAARHRHRTSESASGAGRELANVLRIERLALFRSCAMRSMAAAPHGLACRFEPGELLLFPRFWVGDKGFHVGFLRAGAEGPPEDRSQSPQAGRRRRSHGPAPASLPPCFSAGWAGLGAAAGVFLLRRTSGRSSIRAGSATPGLGAALAASAACAAWRRSASAFAVSAACSFSKPFSSLSIEFKSAECHCAPARL